MARGALRVGIPRRTVLVLSGLLLAFVTTVVAWPGGLLTAAGDPIAQDDTYTVEAGAVLTVNAVLGVLANDTDPDNDPLTADLTTPPSVGGVVLAADGSFVYTPFSPVVGDDTFGYEASDTVGTGAGTVTITATDTTAPPSRRRLTSLCRPLDPAVRRRIIP